VRSVVADSAYNAGELEVAGWPDATVIPLLLDLPSPPPTSEPSDPSILFVGRIVPSKRIDDLIRVLGYVREHHIPGATLDIIGALPERGTYAEDLRSLIDQLGLRGAARLRGRVSDADRDAAYARAGVYLSMSAHEGFCAPLLEAMAHGLPVVARAAGAVRETTGRAALLVHGPDIALAGEAVAAALTDMGVRSGLRANAVRRLADVRPEVVEPAILGAVTPLLTA
jgi:glycosyltransferase involved in cell wall biosynthesis